MQIRIALSANDEKKLLNSLAKFNLYCLPRFFYTDCPKVSELGQLSDRDQVIFSQSFKHEVLKNIKSITSDPSKFHVLPKGGNCIEWTRSLVDEESGTYNPGRFYFEPDPEISEERSAYLTKVYRFIYTQIKKNGIKSSNHFPIYVGKDLASLVSQGIAKLTYPNGKEVIFNLEKRVIV